jgi:Propeller
LWAIAANGSIIRRVGVTAVLPQGDSWEAVLSEHTFKSISIGVHGRIWAVTTQGSPTLRHRVNSDNPDGISLIKEI